MVVAAREQVSDFLQRERIVVDWMPITRIGSLVESLQPCVDVAVKDDLDEPAVS